MTGKIRDVKTLTDLIAYFSENLGWPIDLDDFEDIEDISYDFEAQDIGLKEESFAKIVALRQLQPLTDRQKWGIFCVEFDSHKFEPSALKKILSGFIPTKRNSASHKVWAMQDLLFICQWGKDNNSTLGLIYFEDRPGKLPLIKMFSCAPAEEDVFQIEHFEQKLSRLCWPENPDDSESWRKQWASAFRTYYKQVIRDSEVLSETLALEARDIRNRIIDIFTVEREDGYVHELYKKFQTMLIHDISEQEFADMYAQTIVYGLFSARCMDPTQEDFDPEEAINCIPSTNPFLKNLMQDCLGNDTKNRLSFDELEIGNVVELLEQTNTDCIIQDFNRQTGGGNQDPVIYFYENFLKAYDKTQKVQRGVFYTPQPVVNFMVRAVDDILKTEFGYEDGLASIETKKIYVSSENTPKRVKETVPAIQILDPAVGTGTFLRQIILTIHQTFLEKHVGEDQTVIAAAWNRYVDKHLLPRLNGFELMMAPYAVAHMKLAMVLKDTGYDFSGNNRLNVLLTNSLEEPGNSEKQMSFFAADPLALESIDANAVKKNAGINIVIGNPPYAGESSNKGEYILKLLEDYKKEPGGLIKLQERNPKWINDDYVKFIRYGQKVIEDSGSGILAYICPHGFLDNPTFRGMRWNLLTHFSKIIVLNLHGNIKKKEVSPDGSKDENVFDIQQGVCIIFAIRTEKSVKQAQVFYSDLFGLREKKYSVLEHSFLSEISFCKVSPTVPQYFMTPKDLSLQNEYNSFPSITELMPINSVGIVTGRDGLNVAFTRAEQIEKMKKLHILDTEEARAYFNLGKDVRYWRVEWAKKDVSNVIESVEKYIQPYSYRLFDTRYTCFTGITKGLYCYPRQEIMKNYMYPNVGLIFKRGFGISTAAPAFVTKHISDFRDWSCPGMQGGDYSAPLYIYYDEFAGLEKNPNFSPDVIRKIEKQLDMTFDKKGIMAVDHSFTPEELFDYIYAILNCRQYFRKYVEFIKTDFPHIPIPNSSFVFKQLSSLGTKMRKLHLMEADFSTENIEFIGGDQTVIQKIVFKNNCVYINKSDYFSYVNEASWSFYIGGYQPLQKWLKDRKNRMLSAEEIEHYKKMIVTIDKTIELMDEIDAVIEL